MANSVDSDQMLRSRCLIWVYTVCSGLSVQIFMTIILVLKFEHVLNLYYLLPAFCLRLHWTVIGPTGVLSGRKRSDTCIGLSRMLAGRKRPDIDFSRILASAQSDQGLHCPLTESLDTIECINGEQRPA